MTTSSTRDMKSIIREIDPWDDCSDPPWVYEWSSGRVMYERCKPPAPVLAIFYTFFTNDSSLISGIDTSSGVSAGHAHTLMIGAIEGGNDVVRSIGHASAVGFGASTAAGVGSSAGIATASAVDTGIQGTTGSSSGVASVIGVGSQFSQGVGSSAGVASASAIASTGDEDFSSVTLLLHMDS